MTIEQTVEIHADHRLVLELPLEIPVGKARVLIQCPVLTDRENSASLDDEVERRLGRPPNNEAERAEWAEWLETMHGIRKAHGAWAANPWVNALAEIRAERDACEEIDPWKDISAARDR
jgi:hypothetical protein